MATPCNTLTNEQIHKREKLKKGKVTKLITDWDRWVQIVRYGREMPVELEWGLLWISIPYIISQFTFFIWKTYRLGLDLTVVFEKKKNSIRNSIDSIQSFPCNISCLCLFVQFSIFCLSCALTGRIISEVGALGDGWRQGRTLLLRKQGIWELEVKILKRDKIRRVIYTKVRKIETTW